MHLIEKGGRTIVDLGATRKEKKTHQTKRHTNPSSPISTFGLGLGLGLSEWYN